MAKPHWQHITTGETGQVAQNFGCQHSTCENVATHQWQRDITEAELHTEMNLEGPHGPIVRNPQGPHTVAVFACPDHTPKNVDGTDNLDRMAIRHQAVCPAPDAGCECG